MNQNIIKKLAEERKGKKWSYEEAYGKVKADEIKEKLRQNKLNKNYNELYGKEKAEETKQKMREKRLGKTHEELYGKEKAEEFKRIMKEKMKGKRSPELCRKVSEAKTIWNKEKIIEAFKTIGPIKRGDINIIKKYNPHIPTRQTIIKNFGSLDQFCFESGYRFMDNNFGMGSGIGKNEDYILDHIEHQYGIKLQRRYSVLSKYFIDGYDKENNIAYEIDEDYHKHPSRIEKDIKREKEIKDHLGCVFVRINQREFFKNHLGDDNVVRIWYDRISR